MGSDKKVIHNPVPSIIHMKTFCFTPMIVVFLLLSTNGIQEQTMQTELNQIELMKQFFGIWKCEGEFKTPDMMVETTTVDNKSLRTDTYTRVK